MQRWTFDCVIWGHDDRVVGVPGRVFLECAECGRATAGWDLTRDRSTRSQSSEHVLTAKRVIAAAWRGTMTQGGRIANAFVRRRATIART
jgi:hypothetical protein